MSSISGRTPIGSTRRMKQIFEELRLPRVPHFGTGATDIGYGEEIKRNQVSFIMDATAEGRDDVWIGQVLLLRGGRHD